jgi:hypothetical protein
MSVIHKFNQQNFLRCVGRKYDMNIKFVEWQKGLTPTPGLERTFSFPVAISRIWWQS